MEQIIERMKDFGNEIFINQAVEMEFLVSNSVIKMNLSLENRRDFFLIYKEALTNIHKYADASKVVVELLNEGNTIIMSIKDDGKGFDMEHLQLHRTQGGNGLKNMQARAEKLGGKLMIESKIKEGTTIKLAFDM
jgi:signal transduction histidine kinase